ANNAGLVEVIAGEYRGEKGTASTFSPLHIYNAKLNKGGEAEFELPADYNTAVLVIEGSIVVNGQEQVATDHLALMANDGEAFSIQASEDVVVLILSGKPLNEPIASHGPFVMNTQEQIVEAFQDFQAGKFGYLAD